MIRVIPENDFGWVPGSGVCLCQETPMTLSRRIDVVDIGIPWSAITNAPSPTHTHTFTTAQERHTPVSLNQSLSTDLDCELILHTDLANTSKANNRRLSSVDKPPKTATNCHYMKKKRKEKK